MPKSKRSAKEPLARSNINSHPNKKRSTGKDASKSGTLSHAPPTGFFTLPHELRRMIIELCLSSSEQDRFRANFDSSPVIGALKASRALYAVVAPVLYPRLYVGVELTRPSSLKMFHDAIAARPELRSLVKHLTIGHSNRWSTMSWPLSHMYSEEDGPSAAPRWSLTHGFHEHEWHLLPEWCSPRRQWIPGDAATTCRDSFVLDAIHIAQQHFGIDLQDTPLRSRLLAADSKGSAEDLSIDSFIIGLFNVQAALDLYLLEMRRIDDERGYYVEQESSGLSLSCLLRKCGHYPRLHLSDNTTLPSNSLEDLPGRDPDSAPPFTITATMLHTHLSREAGSTDVFNHPLASARSKMKQWGLDDEGLAMFCASGAYEAVPADDAGAAAVDPTTYAGIVGLSRPVVSMTRARHVYFGWPLREQVEAGWGRKIEEAGSGKEREAG